jgi:hypothetical protein
MSRSFMESRWLWAGIALRDVEGNVVAWELLAPDGQINWQREVSRLGEPLMHRLVVDLWTTRVRTWNGNIPDSPVAIAQYPPLPLDSE